MSGEPGTLWSWRVARMREAFDASFAAALPEPRALYRFLLLRLGSAACAVPLGECATVQRATHVTQLPARNGTFRGLAIVDGAILPVYDLARQVEIDPGDVRPEWIVVAAGPQRVAFLAAAIDGYAETDAPPPAGGEALTMMTIDGVPRRLVSLAATVAAIDRESQLVNRSRSERSDA